MHSSAKALVKKSLSTVASQPFPIVTSQTVRCLYASSMASSRTGNGTATGAITKAMQTPTSSGDNFDRNYGTDARDHLKVTADHPRDPDTHPMTVSSVERISPTVKKVVCSTDEVPVPFSFKPGQWVDLFIPGIEKVGGFSMVSSPSLLENTGNLVLAVKNSEHPPAKWVHNECRKGARIDIRVGGNFFLDSKKIIRPGKDVRVLLIAGGVGINPLASMVFQIEEMQKRFISQDPQAQPTSLQLKTLLLFSAKTADELLFCNDFDRISKEGNLHTKYFITGKAANSEFDEGRITKTNLTDSVARYLNLEPNTDELRDCLQAFICGPPSMITQTKEILCQMGAPAQHIHYENWWQ